MKGAPTLIQEGQLTPNMEALNLLVRFASGEVVMEGDELKHLPSISKSLETIWDMFKRKNTDGSANRTKKTKITFFITMIYGSISTIYFHAHLCHEDMTYFSGGGL